MKYVRITDDQKIEVLLEKPKWYFDNGNQVTDEWLVENANIYKLYEKPTFDPRDFIEKDSSKWIIGLDYVEKTYYNVVNVFEPLTKSLIQKHSIDPESEWEYNDDDNTVTITHRVVERSGEDVDRIVHNSPYYNVPFDPNNSIEKPMEFWRYENGLIYKSYWSVVRDPERSTHPELFYNHTTTDISGWERADTTIQEKLMFSLKDINECKNSLIEYVSLYRWQIETGGYNFNGNGIHTDRESQTKITSIYVLLKNGVVTGNTMWKTMEGFVSLTTVNLENMCLSVSSFIQSLYNKESDIINSITGSTSMEELMSIYNNLKTLITVTGSIFLENN
jgi:hypothetical protein